MTDTAVNKVDKASINRIFDLIYYVYFCVVLLEVFLSRTMIPYGGLLGMIYKLQLVLAGFTVVKLGIEWREKWNANDLFVSIITSVVLLACALFLRDNNLLHYAIIILGAKEIDKKKLLKVFLGAITVLTVVTIVLALSGTINNVVTYRDAAATNGRMALGFTYCTCLAAEVMAIVFVWAILRYSKITWIEVAIMAVLGVGIYVITEARMASFSIIVVAVLCAINKVCSFSGKLKGILGSKIVVFVLIVFGELLLLVSVVSGIVYNSSGLETRETLKNISGIRISAIGTALDRYNLSLLGQNISQLGTQEDGQQGVQAFYSVINNGFVANMYQIGVLGILALLIIFSVVTYKAIKRSDYMTALIIAVFLCFSFFDNRLLYITFNPFLFLLLDKKDGEEEQLLFKKIDISSLKPILTGIVIAFMAEMLIFNYSSVLSYSKEPITFNQSFVTAYNVYTNENGMLGFENENGNLCFAVPTKTGLESAYFDIMLFDTEKVKKNYDNPITVDIFDGGSGEFAYIKSFDIDPTKVSTWYTDINIPGEVQYLLFNVHGSTDVQLCVNAVNFNGPVPFNMNYIRVLIMAVLFGAALFILCRGKDFLGHSRGEDVE